MELEEMRASWVALNQKVEKQRILTDKMIDKMTQEKYKNNLRKVALPEYIGTLICYFGAAYLIINFSKIDGLVFQIFGILSVLLLFTLPVISLKSVRAIKNIKIHSGSYADAIQDYAQRKIMFEKLQKLNVALGLFFLIIFIPTLGSILGKDISNIPHFWNLIFPLLTGFFIIFSYWVLKNYNRALKAGEEILSEIKD
jgi:hypothetical protein